MDRKKMNELPKMQVGFIDFICMPLYQVCVWGGGRGGGGDVGVYAYMHVTFGLYTSDVDLQH